MPEQEQSIDMILVLSSEIVCEIAEAYFNTKMLRKGSQVKVIDLKATEGGLVQFNVEFVREEGQPALVPVSGQRTCESCGNVYPDIYFQVTDDNPLGLRCVYCRGAVHEADQSSWSGQEAHRLVEEGVKKLMVEQADAFIEQALMRNGNRDAKGRFVKVK